MDLDKSIAHLVYDLENYTEATRKVPFDSRSAYSISIGYVIIDQIEVQPAS